MFIQKGEAPTVTIRIPDGAFELMDVKTLLVVFKQRNDIVIKKNLEDCIIDGQRLMVPLMEQEVMQLSHRHTVRVQLRVWFDNGTPRVSKISEITVGELLD